MSRISGDVRRLIGLALAVLAIGSRVPAQRAPDTTLPAALGAPDEALKRVFTPSSLPRDAFAVYATGQAIAALARAFKALDPAPAAGAWAVEKSGVFDAFGSEGPYDKARMALLFGGTSPWIARGSLATPEGRVAIALISPYPDASLASLHPGTMVIVTHLPPAPTAGR